MAAIVYDRAYASTAPLAPPPVRKLLWAFIQRLAAADTATLLGADDEIKVPPIGTYWRHTFGSTGWCVYYTGSEAGYVVRSVTTVKEL